MPAEPVLETEKLTEDQEIEEGRAAALLAYVPFMCFVPLLKMRHNRFALHHGKQGLVLFMVEILALIFYIPFVSRHFWAFVLILALLASIYGLLQVLQGRDWKLPFLGDLAEKIRL
ncbi:MAG TPA: hypothetical protein VI546_05480 [candidate division Zixibacteria bacterium]|nr:hypothetical protein [candidate division Zixibacteria bacterium]